jgi:hypothetical protein
MKTIKVPKKFNKNTKRTWKSGAKRNEKLCMRRMRSANPYIVGCDNDKEDLLVKMVTMMLLVVDIIDIQVTMMALLVSVLA